MKKLMITLAAVAIAAGVNAATYNWEATADWISTEGSTPLEGATAYVFDANAYTYATISAALAGGDTTVLGNALDNYGITDEGYFSMSGVGLTDDGGDPAYAKMYTILVAQDSSKNDWFYQATAPDVKITDGVISGGATFAFGEITTGDVGGTGWTKIETVPEPTSGLLLLLGMAGLALRRRRS